jgi:hypothetical protein
VTGWPLTSLSMHPCMHATQGTISPSLPSLTLSGQSGSATRVLPMPTTSAAPSRSTLSAIAGSPSLFEATTGLPVASRITLARYVYAPGGTSMGSWG